MIATDCSTCIDYRLECAEILNFLCVALLDYFHLSLECDALNVPNNPNLWTENSQWCDQLTTVHPCGRKITFTVYNHSGTVNGTIVVYGTK